jgi:colanic acid/amylovoran biosynthesis glycosyltransferase
MKVLHSIETFLGISENWIYPQVMAVPDVKSAVICKASANADLFSLPSGKLFHTGAANRRFSFQRLVDAAARRLGWNNASLLFRLKAWRPDIIHAHFGPRGWKSLDLKRRLNVPLVTSFYGYDAWRLPKENQAWHERFQELFEEGDIFLAEGPAMRQRLIDIGCPEYKVKTNRIGVDLERLPFEQRNFSDGLRLVMVGRFVEKKGLTDGLRACANARSKGLDISVTIIGGGQGEVGDQIKEELESIASRPELAGRVTFTGMIPMAEVRSLLRKHNVFLCPSRHAANGDAEGGSPVILAEAMAMGLACVGTRHCDIPEVIVDGRTGILLAERDIDAMTDALMLINSDAKESLTMTGIGREHIERRYSIAEQLIGLASIYTKLIKSDIGKARYKLRPNLTQIKKAIQTK